MERRHFEQSKWHPGREDRQNPEVARLETAIEKIIAIPIGDPGSPKALGERLRQLEMILEAIPQRDTQGRLRYLVTSGLAVELVTGFQRTHHDIDLVIMNPDNRRRWDLVGTDNVTPGKYWAGMSFDPEFLEATARAVPTRTGQNPPLVQVVHPAIIMVQKSSDAFGRPPRTKDEDDVHAIIRHWKEKEKYTQEWDPIVKNALAALPPEQIERTRGRLRGKL